MLISKDIFVNLKKGDINEYYEVREKIGQGAYGTVNMVVHKKTRMVRAMKTLNKDQMMMENQQKFLAELFILRGLDHPNILRIFELFENEDNYYLIMEYNLLYIFYTNILYYFLQVLLWGRVV